MGRGEEQRHSLERNSKAKGNATEKGEKRKEKRQQNHPKHDAEVDRISKITSIKTQINPSGHREQGAPSACHPPAPAAAWEGKFSS